MSFENKGDIFKLAQTSHLGAFLREKNNNNNSWNHNKKTQMEKA